MHTETLKKLALALTFWLALHLSALRAQTTSAPPLTVSNTGTNSVDLEFRLDGTFIAKGNYGLGSLLTGDQGAGTRMVWFPALGAFRAGGVDSTQWDASNIGQYSTAFGYDATASGDSSLALGYHTTASGRGALSLGEYTTASADNSIALGLSTTASAQYSIALGNSTSAPGFNATALGCFSMASGPSSTALGFGTTSSGVCSEAMGCNTSASGAYSVTTGEGTTASAYGSSAFGLFNIGGGNPTAWVATDPLFEVGNGNQGTASNGYTPSYSDAFIIYKNGSAAFQGAVTVAPGGDIPMYSGN